MRKFLSLLFTLALATCALPALAQQHGNFPGGATIGGKEYNSASANIAGACVQVTGTFPAQTILGGAGINAQTGTTYTIVAADQCKMVTFSNGSAVAVTLPVASTSGFGANWKTIFVNLGAGTVTITPTTSTINGASTLVLTTGQSAEVYSDATNYSAALGSGTGGGGSAPNITDGITTVTAPPVIDFTSGCVVSNSSGDAHVACTGSGGGSSAGDFVATSETTSSLTYADLATTGPSVTLTTGTSVLVFGSAITVNSAASNTAFMAVAVSGATTVAADDANGVQFSGVAASEALPMAFAKKITGLTPGSNTFKLQYRVDGATFSFFNRSIVVIADSGGGGSSGVEFTDGTNDVTGATKLTITGAVVGGSTPNATLTVSGGSGLAIPQPPGRLTLQNGGACVAIPTADQANKDLVWYSAPTNSSTMPIWNGSAFVMETIPNSGCALLGLDTHQAAGNAYDVFAIDDPGSPGTIQLCTGPAWSGSAARAQAIENAIGLWTNALSMTHCWNLVGGVTSTDFGPISADKGMYLGTIATNASSGHVDWIRFPAAASGGSAPALMVYNAYNKVSFTAIERDSDSFWTYAGTTWRAANNSASNRISYIDGLGDVNVDVTYDQNVKAPNTSNATEVGAVCSTATTPTEFFAVTRSTNDVMLHALVNCNPAIGFHTITAVENQESGGSGIFSAAGLVQELTAHFSGM